jgi:hypothetical protein
VSKRGTVTGCAFSGGSAGSPLAAAAFDGFFAAECFDVGAGGAADVEDAVAVEDVAEALAALGVGAVAADARCARAEAKGTRQKAVSSISLGVWVIFFICPG